jgi:hypothetical protein
MTIVCPDVHGEILLLQYIVGMTVAGNPVLHLYSNDHTPTDYTVKANLTECSAAGYVPITLLSSNWTTTQVGGVTTAVYSEQTFTFSGSAIAYGYYITDTSDKLLWLEKFGTSAFEIPSGGGSISITSKLSLS